MNCLPAPDPWKMTFTELLDFYLPIRMKYLEWIDHPGTGKPIPTDEELEFMQKLANQLNYRMPQP